MVVLQIQSQFKRLERVILNALTDAVVSDHMYPWHHCHQQLWFSVVFVFQTIAHPWAGWADAGQEFRQEKDPQTAHDLLQPAAPATEQDLPENAVPVAARASRASR